MTLPDTVGVRGTVQHPNKKLNTFFLSNRCSEGRGETAIEGCAQPTFTGQGAIGFLLRAPCEHPADGGQPLSRFYDYAERPRRGF